MATQYVVQDSNKVIQFVGTAKKCGDWTRANVGSFVIRPLTARNEQIEPGAYGITAVDPQTPGAMICGSCGRAWLEDITPAGRCPWEHTHAHSDGEDDEDIEALHEEARDYARGMMPADVAWDEDFASAIADAYIAGATR